MGLKSLLSAGAVSGQTTIVVRDAEASLRMLKVLRQSEEEAESSYKVNVEALANQCQIVDEKLLTEQGKVQPIENALEHFRGQLETLLNLIDQKRSLINQILIEKASIPIWGNTDEETRSYQAERDACDVQIRCLEEEIAKDECEADKLKVHIGKIEQLRREVDENINTLSESSRQVHQEKDNYQSEGALAIARLKNEAEVNEHSCQHHHDLAQELLIGRQR